jgi:hypothetical protein
MGGGTSVTFRNERRVDVNLTLIRLLNNPHSAFIAAVRVGHRGSMQEGGIQMRRTFVCYRNPVFCLI